MGFGSDDALLLKQEQQLGGCNMATWMWLKTAFCKPCPNMPTRPTITVLQSEKLFLNPIELAYLITTTEWGFFSLHIKLLNLPTTVCVSTPMKPFIIRVLLSID